MNPDHKLSSYQYHLPEEQIAQSPAKRRDGSKLLVHNRETGERTYGAFSELASFLPPGALLVANNSKVIPARIHGAKTSGGKVEFLLLTPLPHICAHESGCNKLEAVAEGLIRASKSPKPGAQLQFPGGLNLVVTERGEFGRCKVLLRWEGSLAAIFNAHGEMPLPPYISRKAVESDAARYQTVYADESKAGSVAAPTAGLHFTPELRSELKEQGFEWAEVTLFVGYGTFSPVRAKDILDHRMHEEYIEIPEKTATAIRRAKSEGRPVVAVGTTSARTLEGAFARTGEVKEFRGDTDIFISPGYRFQVVDKLLTNFHLPESSLIIMVSALAGREQILESYRAALARGFRFFSYGDAMLIS